MAITIDVIILSLGKTRVLQQQTTDSIGSLLASEDPQQIAFNIVVIESCASLAPYQYPRTKTIYPRSAFGYHKFMNIGIRATSNAYLCLSNNDLVYHRGWASRLLEAMRNDNTLSCASPYDENYHLREGFKKGGPVLEGYLGVLSGWCIFVKRDVFDKIGALDEHLTFWYCDADFCQTLIKHKVKHCLVPTSFVTHLGSTSLKTLEKKQHQLITELPRLYYDYKWQHGSAIKYWFEKLRFKFKMLSG